MLEKEDIRKRAELMEQGKFQGYVAAKLEDICGDIREIKNNDKEQWAAIRKTGWWNKLASALATAAIVMAAYFGAGRRE